MAKKPLKWLGIAAAVFGVIALGATLALRALLDPQKMRTLIVEHAQKALGREVRLKGISIGLTKGLSLDELEVSEKPAFAAGTFAKVSAFQLRVRLMPLLQKRVVIDTIDVKGPSATVILGKNGKFNFDDLLSGSTAPAKGKTADKTAPPPALPFELDVAAARVSGGSIVYKDIAGGAAYRISGFNASAKKVSLERPFPVSMELRADQTAPVPMGADLGFEGTLDLSAWEKKQALAVEAARMSAALPGLEARAAGTIKLAGDRLEMPSLKGSFAGGEFKLALTADKLATAPAIDLQAGLSELDLGKLKAALPAAPEGEKAAASAPAKPAPPSASPPMSAKGKVTIGKLFYTGVLANDVRMDWDLRGITPDLRRLSGKASLRTGNGTLASDSKGGRSKLMKALLLPLTILKTIATLGGKIKILPDLSNIVFSEITGDYDFQNGLMTVNDFHLASSAVDVKSGGTADLPEQRLNLKAVLKIAGIAPIEVGIGGTFDHPKADVKLTKLLTSPATKLADPAINILKGLFKKK